MDNSVKYQRKSNYILRKVGEYKVLISIGENIADFNGYIRLNGSALVLWERLETPADPEELTQLLCKEYGLTKEDAQKDTADFLVELLENKMIEPVKEDKQ